MFVLSSDTLLSLLTSFANQITEVLFTVLHPIALLASYIHMWWYREGRVALPPDREEQSHSGYQRRDQRQREESGEVQRLREVADDELFG
jgi:hypothetical protein